MISNKNIDQIILILRKEVRKYREPIVTYVASMGKDPFKILISTLLSLRTKDEVTSNGTKNLFKLAATPEEMVKLPVNKIEKAIYPVGFYKVKAGRIKEICKTLIEKYDSKVPDELDELLQLKGVGRKTANLVITLGYDKHGICVDVHVNRISNRFGYVKTRNPHETEFALRKKLPKKYWIEYNDILVTFGQNICMPVSPKCSICPINKYCPRIGVKKSR